MQKGRCTALKPAFTLGGGGGEWIQVAVFCTYQLASSQPTGRKRHLLSSNGKSPARPWSCWVPSSDRDDAVHRRMLMPSMPTPGLAAGGDLSGQAVVPEGFGKRVEREGFFRFQEVDWRYETETCLCSAGVAMVKNGFPDGAGSKGVRARAMASVGMPSYKLHRDGKARQARKVFGR